MNVCVIHDLLVVDQQHSPITVEKAADNDDLAIETHAGEISQFSPRTFNCQPTAANAGWLNVTKRITPDSV